jgi:hypothetical protein
VCQQPETFSASANPRIADSEPLSSGGRRAGGEQPRLGGLALQAAGQDQATLTGPPSGGSMSAGQVLDHVAGVEQQAPSAGMVPAQGGGGQRGSGEDIRGIDRETGLGQRLGDPDPGPTRRFSRSAPRMFWHPADVSPVS